jgi:hypothetical protein
LGACFWDIPKHRGLIVRIPQRIENSVFGALNFFMLFLFEGCSLAENTLLRTFAALAVAKRYEAILSVSPA